jgi:hypothetical protein
MELLELSFVFDTQHWFSVSGISFHFKRPEFHVLLHDGFFELPANKSFGIEDCLLRVSGDLILGGITN